MKKISIRKLVVSTAIFMVCSLLIATIPVAASPFFDDVELGPNGWTTAIESGTTDWHVVTNPQTISVLSPDIDDDLVTLPEGPPLNYLPSAHSGSNAWWFGKETTGTFIGDDWTTATQYTKGGGASSDVQRGTLTSPTISLAGISASTLSFWSWWEIESVDADAFDLMDVHITTDYGSTWTFLGRLNPTVDVDGPADKPYTSGGNNVAGVWVQYSFDLTPYVGGDIQIRFRFNTRNHLYNGFRGWLIDDISVEPQAPIPELGFSLPIATSIAASVYLFIRQRLAKRKD